MDCGAAVRPACVVAGRPLAGPVPGGGGGVAGRGGASEHVPWWLLPTSQLGSWKGRGNGAASTIVLLKTKPGIWIQKSWDGVGWDATRAEGLNRPRPSPTLEPPAHAVSWCWAERRGSLPGGRGEQYRPKSQKSWNLGGGVVGAVRMYSWKVNCKIVAVIILALG